MIKGLIFDFDGLIIDTEVGEYQSWQEIYQEYGIEYPASEFQKLIGIYTPIPVPLEKLDRLKGPLDREAINSRRYRRSVELSTQQPILPGVMNYLVEAQRIKFKDSHCLQFTPNLAGQIPETTCSYILF